jgi:uncharacterized protein with HEPN domain
MSKRTDSESLQDILEAIHRITTYIASMTYESFVNDTKTQDAVIRNIEILGEASKNLSEVIRAKYPNIPWKSMSQTRDRLIHHYFGVNLDIVWGVITLELPQLVSKIQGIVEDEGEKGTG